MPSFLLLLPVISTLAGGLLALRFRRLGSGLMALAAGLLLGAAFLDLLPEALDLGNSSGLHTAELLGWALISFLLFTFAEALVESGLPTSASQASVGDSDAAMRSQGLDHAGRQVRRQIGGAMLIFHSFRDGMAIGAAYAASHPLGYAVALGIIVHDLGDGMNTILVTAAPRDPHAVALASPSRMSYAFLAADALAPLFGGLLTLWWVPGSRPAAILLAISAGFFLQMATSEFLPQLRAERVRRPLLYGLVAAGAAMLFVANRLLGI